MTQKLLYLGRKVTYYGFKILCLLLRSQGARLVCAKISEKGKEFISFPLKAKIVATFSVIKYVFLTNFALPPSDHKNKQNDI